MKIEFPVKRRVALTVMQKQEVPTDQAFQKRH
jgi:hypothetical protein